jgi:hypothetical protein
MFLFSNIGIIGDEETIIAAAASVAATGNDSEMDSPWVQLKKNLSSNSNDNVGNNRKLKRRKSKRQLQKRTRLGAATPIHV